MAGYNYHLIIVIQAADRNLAHVSTKAIDPVGGEKAFIAALVPRGQQGPASHYILTWRCKKAEYDALVKEFGPGNGKRSSNIFDGNLWTVERVLEVLGLEHMSFPLPTIKPQHRSIAIEDGVEQPEPVESGSFLPWLLPVLVGFLLTVLAGLAIKGPDLVELLRGLMGWP